MNLHIDNLHSPNELRIIGAALTQIADLREKSFMAKFGPATPGKIEFDIPNRNPAPEAAQEEASAPKRQRAAKAAPAVETTTASETTSAPASAPAAAEGNAAAEPSTPEAPAASTASSPEPAPTADITLEEVRAKLASLSQDGKAAQVKGLIAQFGVSKLTDVPKEKYAALMAEAGEL